MSHFLLEFSDLSTWTFLAAVVSLAILFVSMCYIACKVRIGQAVFKLQEYKQTYTHTYMKTKHNTISLS